MRKTKIICTLGPSTDKEGVLRELIANGMNVARFNFSHGSHEEHLGRLEKLKALREELGKPVAALLDTKGPEIRLKDFKNGVENLVAGQTFTLTTRDVEGTNEICSITYKDLPMDVEPNGTIMLDDGLIKLQIQTVNDTDIVCTVLNNGKIKNKKGVNVPGVHLSMPYMSQRDKDDIIFGIQQGYDFIAASFVRTAQDVYDIRNLLNQYDSNIRIIAKIENREAVLDRVEREIGYPAFVKPANLGSSIGITKARDRQSLADAIDTAASFDRRILVEHGVDHPDEVNCAAVGYGKNVTVSVCEMPVSWQEFLTFDEKYLRGGKGGNKGGVKGGVKSAMPAKGMPVKGGGGKNGMASLSRQIPAPIPDEMTNEIRSMTEQIFRVMDLKGVVRVDYIIDKAENKVYVNEVNTIPGSLAFYLFEPVGISYRELIDRMVDAAIEAHEEREASSFSFQSAILTKATGGAKR